MSKLRNRGAKTALSSVKRDDLDKFSRITTVKKKVTTSYKVAPMTLRMSINDKKIIGDWVDELQELTSRNVSPAKLFRALALYKDNIDDEELIKLIDKMN